MAGTTAPALASLNDKRMHSPNGAGLDAVVYPHTHYRRPPPAKAGLLYRIIPLNLNLNLYSKPAK